jgi:hypothetical protein
MVRAKFVCTLKSIDSDGVTGRIQLYPVMDGSEENKDFFKYTPGGHIDLQVMNPLAVEQFEAGKEYYVDFTPADFYASTTKVCPKSKCV